MINELVAKIKKTQAPIVVGLDPTLKLIPKHLFFLVTIAVQVRLPR